MGHDRITRDQMLMEIAQSYAKRGTCTRAQVGAVVARQGRVIVGAYNGAPSGMPHCRHDCDCGSRSPEEMMKTFGKLHVGGCPADSPCLVSVHAEANAVAWTARNGGRLDGAHLYTTLAPCVNCAMLIINAGIYRVVCAEPYRDQAGVELLRRGHVKVSKIHPSDGKTYDWFTSVG